MRNWILILTTFCLTIPAICWATANTRLGSYDIQNPACFTSSTISSSGSCYLPAVDASITGTVPVTGTFTPGGTQFVSVTSITGTSFVNIGGGTAFTTNTGTSFVSVTGITGTSFVTTAGGTSFVTNTGTDFVSVTGITGTSFVTAAGGTSFVTSTGTSFVSLAAGTATVNVASITGTSFVTVGAGTVSALPVGTQFVSVTDITGTSFVTVGAGTVSALPVGTQFVSVTAITGTTFANIIPNAIVTEGVGSKSVSTSGTSLRLASQAARMVIIKANAANTNSVYIVPGGTTSQDYSSTANPGGFELSAKESITLPLISNISEITIDATTSGEGVNYTWIGY